MIDVLEQFDHLNPLRRTTRKASQRSTPGFLDQFPEVGAGFWTLGEIAKAAFTGNKVVTVRETGGSTSDDFTTAGTALEAEVDTFVGANDGVISDLYDHNQTSGFDLTQTFAPEQPFIAESGTVVTQGGLPVIKHPGGSDYGLYSASVVISQPFTVIAVVSRPNSATNTRIFESLSDRVTRINVGFGGQVSMYAGSGTLVSTENAPNDDLYIVSALFNGASSWIRVNGVQTSSGTNPGASGLDGLHLSTDGSEWLGNQAAFGVYPSDKISIIGDMESYLATLWGITL
jgi:hypothetical protein